MDTELFIARRLFGGRENKEHLSGRIIAIALTGIALGMTLMLLAVAVVTGFKKEIRNKVTGFGGHIQVVNFDTNLSYETAPVSCQQPFLSRLASIGNIRSVVPFATKPGIIKTGENIQGVVLKGVDNTYPWEFFKTHLTQGKIPSFQGERSPEVLVSENLCALLRLKTEDTLYIYFINENERIPRIRQFRISGVYRTNLQEFDNLFVIGDLRQVRHINNWDSLQISGFEIMTADFSQLDATTMRVRESVTSYNTEPGSTLRTLSIRQKFPQIFDWLSILDMNVWVILTLMVMVAGFNMISALLVLILERSRMIGTLKSLGSPDKSIRRIFLYLSGFLIARGLFWGNLLGLALFYLQKFTGIIRLDPASYYMEIVPVHLTLGQVLALNGGALGITLLMMILPTLYISRISPDKTLRFD